MIKKIAMVLCFVDLVINNGGLAFMDLVQRVKKVPGRAKFGLGTHLLLLILYATAGSCFEQEWRRPRFHFFGDGYIPGTWHFLVEMVYIYTL